MLAPITLQLYTVREALKANLQETISKIADIGYIGVESYDGLDAIAVKKVADSVGLQIMGSHASPPVGENKDRILEMAQIYDVDNIVIPGLPHDKFKSRAGIAELCALVNAAYENAKAVGLKLGYHNHEYEFASIDDTTGYQIFLNGLNSDVFIELDTYWAQNAGQDVTILLNQIGSRTPFLHIKDGPGGAHDAPQLALGEGIMDIDKIVKAHDSDWLIVELDSCATDMLEAVEKSYRYLISKGLARGNK